MRQTRRPLQGIALYSAILSQLVGSILIGTFTGMWIDKTYGTTPVFLVICLLLGLLAGVLALITTIRKYDSGD
ncbi:AtpZ/AtpI family protein [Psychrobacillus sp. OK032]|uniref:AtpZ/AtpI family protein n=1 Tax=Psychrobacillus sp. OK032 TaxID=1884358 RepID=UPI0008D326C3|nr:AtpZ/AtpI family protein [Psychrobacillus sp. OK032]SES03361.1 Putative F0F1-ATPase subunit Ca2+/Mg2+ transporter [Psychrobacillus sp. OK032]